MNSMISSIAANSSAITALQLKTNIIGATASATVTSLSAITILTSIAQVNFCDVGTYLITANVTVRFDAPGQMAMRVYNNETVIHSIYESFNISGVQWKDMNMSFVFINAVPSSTIRLYLQPFSYTTPPQNDNAGGQTLRNRFQLTKLA